MLSVRSYHPIIYLVFYDSWLTLKPHRATNYLTFPYHEGLKRLYTPAHLAVKAFFKGWLYVVVGCIDKPSHYGLKRLWGVVRDAPS